MRKIGLIMLLLSSFAYGYLDFQQDPTAIVIRNNANINIERLFVWKYGRSKFEFNTVGGSAKLNFVDISSLAIHGSLKTYNGTLNFNMNEGGKLEILGGGSWSADTSDMNNNYNALIATLEGVNNFEMGNNADVVLNGGLRAFGSGASNRFLMDNSTLTVRGSVAVSANGGSENLIKGANNAIKVESVHHEQTGANGYNTNNFELTDSNLTIDSYVFSNWGTHQQGGNYFMLSGGKQVFNGNIGVDNQNGGYNHIELSSNDVTFGGKRSHIQYLGITGNSVLRYKGDVIIDSLKSDGVTEFIKSTPDIAVLTITEGNGNFVFKADSTIMVGQHVATAAKGVTFTTEWNDDGLVVTGFSLRKLDEGNRYKWIVGEDIKVFSPTAIARVEEIIANPYEIYLFNFNSLNKRMGELRSNRFDHGVWSRVYGGSGKNDYNNSTTGFVSVQAGYDYGFEVKGGMNYLGIAGSYSYSDSKLNHQGKLVSNMYDFGLYNSYVQDEGWFNDTIFKVGMINNDLFKNTLTYTLSNEVGYRFKLGEKKKWYIDPQAEIAFGYVDGNKFDLSNAYSRINIQQDGLLMLRSRLGVAIGYDFGYAIKEDLSSNVYVSGHFEMDNYFQGGSTLNGYGARTDVKNKVSGNDYRGVLNYGLNIEAKDGLNVYLDMEHSFGGKIGLDYKVNGGLRFSFGTKNKVVENESDNPVKLSEDKKS